jgi:uncharacterized membrane protein
LSPFSFIKTEETFLHNNCCVIEKDLMKPIQDILPVNVSDKERVVSGAIGAALLVMGLLNVNQPGVKTFLELGTGALMLFRGTSGYCPVNAVIGRNTADVANVAEEKFEALAE